MWSHEVTNTFDILASEQYCTSKSRPLPYSASDQLEGASGDLLTSSCHSNYCGHPPSLVAGLQGRPLGEEGGVGREGRGEGA